MTAALRFIVATGICSAVVVGLFACSGSVDDSGDPIPDPPTSKPAVPTGSENPSVTPPVEAGTATQAPPTTPTTPPPKTCPILSGASDAGPDLQPAACKTCAVDKCCAPITKCFGASVGDAGKTSCQAFGDCEAACNGDPVCGTQCEVRFGDAIAADWYAYDGCISGSSPAGCNDFCN